MAAGLGQAQPQAFSTEKASLRVIKAWEAPHSACRTRGSPALVIRPGLSVSPDW